MRQVFLSACGLKADTQETALLTSLPCELAFNDLRDSEKRGQKSVYRSPPAIAAAAVKSAWKRSPLQHLQLESKDWADRESARHLKNSILAGAKQIDKELGIPMHELTHQRQCPHMTKPHELTQRLCLFVTLLAEYRQNAAVDVEALVSNVWTLRLLTACTLWKLSESEDAETRLVLQSGPWTAQFIVLETVELEDNFYYKIPLQAAVENTVTFKPTMGLLSVARGVANCEFGLLFKPEAFMTPTRFLLTHRVLEMPSSFVSAFCRLVGLNLGRCTHAERVRRLLEREGFDDAYIKDIMDALPAPVARARAAGADAAQDRV